MVGLFCSGVNGLLEQVVSVVIELFKKFGSGCIRIMWRVEMQIGQCRLFDLPQGVDGPIHNILQREHTSDRVWQPIGIGSFVERLLL